MFIYEAGIDFKREHGRVIRADLPVGEWCGPGVNPYDPVLTVDEQNIKGQGRVCHPETAGLLLIEDEIHAGVEWQGMDIHESGISLAFGFCQCYFDLCDGSILSFGKNLNGMGGIDGPAGRTIPLFTGIIIAAERNHQSRG